MMNKVLQHVRQGPGPGAWFALGLTVLPASVWAQGSPWLTGANSLVANLQAWAAPIAVLAIMFLAFLAMASRMSWGTALSVMVAIVLLFGAPQVVVWVRGMFAV